MGLGYDKSSSVFTIEICREKKQENEGKTKHLVKLNQCLA